MRYAVQLTVDIHFFLFLLKTYTVYKKIILILKGSIEKYLRCQQRAIKIVRWREAMKPVTVYCKSLKVNLDSGPDIRDITSLLEEVTHESQVENGCLSATMMGSTGSLTTIEFEPGVVSDLIAAVNRLAPPHFDYEHEKAWHDGNGHSHVQAALLGPSIALPIRQRRLKTGTWQQVVAINHDNRSRQRTIEVTITGTTA
jgi:secondary thiamine-phosphate synthase enzyme